MSTLHEESAWRNYDESFRHLKENSNLPWQKPVKELRIKQSLLFFIFLSPRSKVYSCHFTHLCHSCKGNHLRISCKTDQKSDNNPQSPYPVQDEPLRHELQGYSFSEFLLYGFFNEFRWGLWTRLALSYKIITKLLMTTLM